MSQDIEDRPNLGFGLFRVWGWFWGWVLTFGWLLVRAGGPRPRVATAPRRADARMRARLAR